MRLHLPAPSVGMPQLSRGVRSAAVALALSASFLSHAATSFIDGEAMYLAKIMPPPDATLVVTLQNATRAGASAVEHASTSLRINNGPPYSWRLSYDASLGDPKDLSVRARITTPAGLWMSTDTMTPALSGAAPLRLRLVAVGAQRAAEKTPAVELATTAEVAPRPAVNPVNPVNPADPCAQSSTQSTTQADMARCAQEDFEAASSGYAQRYAELSKTLSKAQRDRLRRMQSAWLKFQTQACEFDSGPTVGGSIQNSIYWRCAARMTRERTVALEALAHCREGDVTCNRKAP